MPPRGGIAPATRAKRAAQYQYTTPKKTPMRLLLTTLNAKYIHINLAIRLLYELNHAQYEGLEMREFTIKEDKQQIAEACAEYDIVCFSCYIWNIEQTLEVCTRIKALRPDCKILLGGPEVSYEWENVIALPCVDFIITGEGEVPFAEFLQHYPANLGAVSSLVRKDAEGDALYNSEVKGFDLQNYADMQPYRHDPPETLRNKVLYIETSRGCPYKCEFCLASLDNKVRYLPMPSIKTMLLYLMQHGRVIKFLDRTFNIKKVFTLEIFEFILANYREGNVFQFEITADILHPDIVRFIQERVPRGLFRFEIGVQTTNQVANREMQRKQNFEKTAQMVRALQDKIEMHLDLIVGLPYDSWADIRRSVDEVFALYPPELQLGFLKLLKGTPVREKEELHGLVFDKRAPYQLLESKYLSRAEIARIEIMEEALEVYWNKGRALNTLRYLHQTGGGIFDFLLDLGEFFVQKSDFHAHSMRDIFDILLAYVEQEHSSDAVLRAMVAVDYYLFSKVRPQPFAAAEIEKEALQAAIERLRLPKKQGRYIALNLPFDWQAWADKSQILPASDAWLWLQYEGQERAKILNINAAEQVG